MRLGAIIKREFHDRREVLTRYCGTVHCPDCGRLVKLFSETEEWSEVPGDMRSRSTVLASPGTGAGTLLEYCDAVAHRILYVDWWHSGFGPATGDCECGVFLHDGFDGMYVIRPTAANAAER